MTIFKERYNEKIYEIDACDLKLTQTSTPEEKEKARNLLFTYTVDTFHMEVVDFLWCYRQIFREKPNIHNYIEFIVDLYGHREEWSPERISFVIEYIKCHNLYYKFKGYYGVKPYVEIESGCIFRVVDAYYDALSIKVYEEFEVVEDIFIDMKIEGFL